MAGFILDEVTELLFPKRCPFCHEIIPVKGENICRDCRRFIWKYYLIKEPVCKKCGKSISSYEKEYCSDCLNHTRSFDFGISVFLYGKKNIPDIKGKKPGFESHYMGESMIRFKYHNCCDYADYYIEELVNIYGKRIHALKPDVIIPVPVHPKRMKKRGYNQAEILADKLGQMINIPVVTDVLVRVKKTLPQKELGTEERLKNLKEAFAIKKELPTEYKNIILIDDIYTTGSTMEICCRKLKHAGAHKVICISICSGEVE